MEEEFGDIEYYFSSYIRVQRKLDTAKDIANTYFSVKNVVGRSKQNDVSDDERIQLLDLPDIESRENVLPARKSPPQDNIIIKMASGVLSRTEASVFVNRYWPHITPKEHEHRVRTENDARRGRLPGQPRARPRYAGLLVTSVKQIRHMLQRPSEEWALEKAWLIYGPGSPLQRAYLSCPGSRPWVHRWVADSLAVNKSMSLGYTIYVDKEVQRRYGFPDGKAWVGSGCNTCPTIATAFHNSFQCSIYRALRYIHADHLLTTWLAIQPENTSEVPSITKEGTVDCGRERRGRAIYWPRNAEIDDDAIDELRRIFKQKRDGNDPLEGLTNVFLVIDPTCFHSVVRIHRLGSEDDKFYGAFDQADERSWGERFRAFDDGMRILAVDPDYPRPNTTYPEEYAGHLWVRTQQLVDKFYEMRKYHPEIGLEKLWLAAKLSRNEAFVSMDPEEAQDFHENLPYDSLFGKIYYDTANNWVMV